MAIPALLLAVLYIPPSHSLSLGPRNPQFTAVLNRFAQIRLPCLVMKNKFVW